MFCCLVCFVIFTQQTIYDYEVAIYEELNGSNEWNGSVLAALLLAATAGALIPTLWVDGGYCCFLPSTSSALNPSAPLSSEFNAKNRCNNDGNNDCKPGDVDTQPVHLAPAPAVAELTIGLMLQLARNIGLSNQGIKDGSWERILGYRLSEMTIGIIGSGRIGGRVIRRLSAFGSPRILVNSLKRDDLIAPNIKLEWVDKKYIYKHADLISLHVPLTNKTLGMIGREELKLMNPSTMLINTARGGIINEDDLYWALKNGVISQSAIDVFLDEPYKGPLKNLNNCHLTAHLGSMSFDCRARMEIEAVEEVINYYSGKEFNNIVPEEEYNLSK